MSHSNIVDSDVFVFVSKDFAAEKCSMPYRAPELFQVESDVVIDEKVDVWVSGVDASTDDI